MKHFVIRTIRKGRVRIHGKWFTPSEQHQKYNGQLEGLRYVFSLYPNHATGGLEKFVSLWGLDQYDKEGFLVSGPEVVNGYLPWIWWNEI